VKIWWGEAPEESRVFPERLTLAYSKATLDRSACRAVGLPCRSSLVLESEMVAWILQTKRFTLLIRYTAAPTTRRKANH